LRRRIGFRRWWWRRWWNTTGTANEPNSHSAFFQQDKPELDRVDGRCQLFRLSEHNERVHAIVLELDREFDCNLILGHRSISIDDILLRRRGSQ
jgi:hypothetical protein